MLPIINRSLGHTQSRLPLLSLMLLIVLHKIETITSSSPAQPAHRMRISPYRMGSLCTEHRLIAVWVLVRPSPGRTKPRSTICLGNAPVDDNDTTAAHVIAHGRILLVCASVRAYLVAADAAPMRPHPPPPPALPSAPKRGQSVRLRLPSASTSPSSLIYNLLPS